MKKRFEGKVAVVVGGAGGIGQQIVRQLLEEGACVATGDMDEERLAGMQKELGDMFLGKKTNVIDRTDQEDLVKETVGRFGKLDLAFNVAGGSRMGLIDEGSIEDWDFTVELCLKGTYLGMRYQIAQMRKDGGGSIVNISSENAIAPMWADSAYSAAKNAVITLTQTAVLENAKHNIRCNAILPGLIDTKMTQSWTAVAEIDKAFREKIPMHRAGRPDEIAKAALFLASEDASYISGTTLLVDGGWAAAGYPDISEPLEKDRTLWEV